MKIGDIAVHKDNRNLLATLPPIVSGIVVSVRPFVLALDKGPILRGLDRSEFRIEGPAPLEAAVQAFNTYVTALAETVDTRFEMSWVHNAFDGIDAGFFSGDAFESAEDLARCLFYFERWKRRMLEVMEIMIEVERAVDQ